jgi:transcription elongation GreA/GreB family factor
VVAPEPADNLAVRFGHTVIIVREDDRRQTFRIVGEDEADPARGTISHASPLARALFGKGVGEGIAIAGGEAEIVNIR